MTVETLVSSIIDQLPNLAIALLVLYWQRKTIDDLLSHQRTLIDRLLQMVDIVSEGQSIHIQAGSKSTIPPSPSSETVNRVTTLSVLALVMMVILR